MKVNYPIDLIPRDEISDSYEGADGLIKVSDPYRVLEDPSAEITK